MGDDDNALEAADAAARLRAWFEAEGPLVMDEADFDDVQTVLADYGRVLVENERLRAQAATDVRVVDATLKAWAVADQAKLSNALLGLREVFIWRIAEAQVRERHAFEDARDVEAGRQGSDAPGCLCPHDLQPDGALVRDGVLAAGCPVHDPDAGESGGD